MDNGLDELASPLLVERRENAPQLFIIDSRHTSSRTAAAVLSISTFPDGENGIAVGDSCRWLEWLVIKENGLILVFKLQNAVRLK